MKNVVYFLSFKGESNSNDAPKKYDSTFPILIRDWREQFQAGTDGQTEENFPFGFVQVRE